MHAHGRGTGARGSFPIPSIRVCAAVLTLMLVLAGPVSAAAETDKNSKRPAVAVGASVQAIRNPKRLAEGLPGELMVAERSGSVVAIDMDSLAPLWSFTLPNEGTPFGLATWNREAARGKTERKNDRLLVFVGNTETKNVEVYKVKLKLRRDKIKVKFKYNLGGTPKGAMGTIGKPISIAVDQVEELVFVLDGQEKSVKVFDRKGDFEYAFAPKDQDGAVLSPVALTLDQTRREVLVTDFGDPSGSLAAATPARILIYDYEGTLLDQIDGGGFFDTNLIFRRAQGMATSSDGRIFVADPLGHRILVLDRSSGALLEELGAAGQEPGQLFLPTDVFLDEQTGDLFVSNNQGARRVEVILGAGR